jgi:hypothetical protein
MNAAVIDEVTPLISHQSKHNDDTEAQDPCSSQSLQSSSIDVNPNRRTTFRSISWDNYVFAVGKYPIITKCITATIILGSADLVAQGLEFILHDESRDSPYVIDWIRTIRFGALGLFGAPWSHYYFYWLDHYLPPSDEPWTKRTALKVFIDQFIQAPILLALMIFALGLMKGQGFNGATRDLADTYMESLIANCKFDIFLCVSDAAQFSLRICTILILSYTAIFFLSNVRETLDSRFYH